MGNNLEELSGIMELDYISGEDALGEFAKIYLGEDNVELAEVFLQDSNFASFYCTVIVINVIVDKLSSKIVELKGVRNIEVFQNSPVHL